MDLYCQIYLSLFWHKNLFSFCLFFYRHPPQYRRLSQAILFCKLLPGFAGEQISYSKNSISKILLYSLSRVCIDISNFKANEYKRELRFPCRPGDTEACRTTMNNLIQNVARPFIIIILLSFYNYYNCLLARDCVRKIVFLNLYLATNDAISPISLQSSRCTRSLGYKREI